MGSWHILKYREIQNDNDHVAFIDDAEMLILFFLLYNCSKKPVLLFNKYSIMSQSEEIYALFTSYFTSSYNSKFYLSGLLDGLYNSANCGLMLFT